MLPALLGAGRMAMQYLPYISAAVGGLPGLMKGDLKEAATGAGIGYLGGRLAKPSLGRGAGRIVEAAPGLASVAGSTMPIGKALQLGALGGTALAAGVGAPVIGRLASAAAQPITSLADQAASAASQALGVGSRVTGIGQPQLPAMPGYAADQLTPGQVSQYGPQNLAQTFDPTGYQQAQLALEKQQYMQNLQSALQALPYQERYQQRSKEADFLRGAKAAQLATALSTDAAMRRQGQLGAQSMANQFLTNLGTAGATQYRYF